MDAELAIDLVEVLAHCPRRQLQAVGDDRVGYAGRHQGDDLGSICVSGT
jgi:hypothetical protein